jgi:hypothetical protein
VAEACDANFWCLFLHAFFLMSRKSNLVPNSVKTLNSNKQLCRSNIEINSEKNILLINISWSKTIQFGERNLVVPLISIPDSPLCPVKAYHNMISLVPTTKNSLAFTELGTKLLFLLIKKNACKNKHQKFASQASATSSFL